MFLNAQATSARSFFNLEEEGEEVEGEEAKRRSRRKGNFKIRMFLNARATSARSFSNKEPCDWPRGGNDWT